MRGKRRLKKARKVMKNREYSSSWVQDASELEMTVLTALLKSKHTRQHYPKEGNDTRGVAEALYDCLNGDKSGGNHHSPARSSLYSILQKLFLKGLVKKCRPVQHGGTAKTKFLRVFSLNETGLCQAEEEVPVRTLPYGCRVWWMPTKKAKQLIEVSTGGLREI